MSAEYPNLDKKSREAALSAAKKLIAHPKYMNTAGEIVFAANVNRDTKAAQPKPEPERTIKPAEQPKNYRARVEATIPELSRAELRAIQTVLPALQANGRISVEDFRRYKDLIRERLRPNPLEFAVINRRYILGSGGILAGFYGITYRSTALAVDGTRRIGQMHKEVSAKLDVLYDLDPRNLHGKAPANSKELKGEMEIKDEREEYGSKMLFDRGRGLEEGKQVLGVLGAFVSGLVSIFGTYAFVDNLKDRWHYRRFKSG